MTSAILNNGDIHTLKYVITHVFCPPHLPDRNDHSIRDDHSLASSIANAARLYGEHVDQAYFTHWSRISRMLENISAILRSENMDRSQIITQFSNMDAGDVVAVHIRAQNAGVIFRKDKDVTIFESFELSPQAQNVMTTEGKLICSYPGPAIEVPNLVFDNKDFRSELANFLAHMNHDDLGDAWWTFDAVRPRYITELLAGILRSVGCPADMTCIKKRVEDEVVCNDDSKLPWRRSALWLLIRVSIQTTLHRYPLRSDWNTYKEFILFFMCSLAAERACSDLPSDLLKFMAAKISRRLRKLGASAPDWLTCIVSQTCTSLRSIIEDRWEQVQAAQSLSPPWDPSRLDLARDIQLSLFSSGDYLCKAVISRRNTASSDNPFNYGQHPRGILHDFLSLDGAFFEEAYRNEPYIALYDVERAVEEGIDTWLDGVMANGLDDACVKLEMLANKYSSNALKTYANNPELLSVMLLTTVELWVALDKLAVKGIPILADYSPEVPTSLLEHLLLCKASHLDRLRRAYEYLSYRHSRARAHWSVFSPEITLNSFSIRYYKESKHLRSLKIKIEKAAKQEVRQKVAELWKMNTRFIRLFIGDAVTISAHDSDVESEELWIGIYEWPLPANELQAKVVVFELDCPVSFNMWRAATLHLLVDICSPPVEQSDRPRIELSKYDGLVPYLVEHPRSRVSLGSNTRSPFFSHSRVAIPAMQATVCIKNYLTFFSFDVHSGVPVSEALGRSDTRGFCTYKLQSGLYQNLQKYAISTSHTANEIIASQAECSHDLSIHEYMAFCHLRSGGLLQWLNILRELRSRSLSFRRPEVHMLLVQAVSQVGPFANGVLTWHEEILQPTFCNAFLHELESLVKDVEANWMEGITMDTVSFLVRRLLASRPDNVISLKATNLLRIVRNKVFCWAQELLAGLSRTSADGRSRGILLDTAVICRSTFDVDLAMIPKLLHSEDDLQILLSLSIIIRDHIPSDVSSLSAHSRLLLDRDRRLSLSLERIIGGIIQTDVSGGGINLAVCKVWPGYHPGSKWMPLWPPDSRWFSCTTASRADQRSQVVHFNVLDGSLLVDGRPLGPWLPDEYTRHPLYKLIFGDQMLAVTQSDLPGMGYSTRDMISDHQVYFSLENSGLDLVIRAKRKKMVEGDSELVELVPREKLRGDLPLVLIEGYVHWLDLSSFIMELRPLDSLWEASSENWKIDCNPGRYCMRKGHESLVDIRSHSWTMVSSLLRPLSTPDELIITTSPTDPNDPTSRLQLSVSLPRYELSFYVDEDGDLQSRNIQGMAYDENQSVETFFGLVSQLVLRPKRKEVNAVELIPRCVIVPEGELSFRMEGHHVLVEITPDCSVLNRVAYQIYRVNAELGCLMGNGSLTSKLYCAYLHAITSGSSEDPLTGRSGTKEALAWLESASLGSNVKFSPRDAELLGLIASIPPSIAWYDPKRFIQKVEWRNLPTDSQNHELYFLAEEIKGRYERLQIFQECSSDLSFQFPSQNENLLKRSARRTTHFYLLDSSESSTELDLVDQYFARDDRNSGEFIAYNAATSVYRRIATIQRPTDMWKMVESWRRNVSGSTGLSLRYDRSWLAPSLPSIWLNAYNLLRENDERKWFRLLFSLPSMAYGASSNVQWIVPVFVSFASLPQFRSEDPPNYDTYRIDEGCYPSSENLRNFVVTHAHPFEGSPESQERGRFNDSNPIRVRLRQNLKYDERVQSDARIMANTLLEAWPCESPPMNSLDPKLYDVTELETRVQRHFSDCFRNLELKNHLVRVQAILDKIPRSQIPSRVVSSPPTSPPVSPPDSPPAYSDSFGPLGICIPASISWVLTLHQLFERPAPQLQPLNRLPRSATEAGNNSLTPSTSLHQLVTIVDTKAENSFQHKYVSALRTSAESFGSDMSLEDHLMNPPSANILLDHYMNCRSSYLEALRLVQQYLGPRNESEQAVKQAGEWPCIAPHVLFRCLASTSSVSLPADWKKCIIELALLALELQRARRLVLLCFENHQEELSKELQNEGCNGWDAEVRPDWLLIQLQGNFLIRRVQAEVANEMISPTSGDNTAMQLNMGEGKSSVILPIIAVALANADQLVRIIVPKPLMAQTLQLLADRLSGLTNRRLYCLPFSRSLQLTDDQVVVLRETLLECMQSRGILVVQPEHVLSLKLVSVEKQLPQSESGPVGQSLLELQRWLYSHSRDILDESDEILDVRSHLVFTVGQQQYVEGYPERWTTTEQVLSLVSKHASSLWKLFPLGVEYESGPPGSFPFLRVLQKDAGEKLVSWIVQDVIEGQLSNISFGHLHFHSGLEDAIRVFISLEDVPPTELQMVEEYFAKTPLWGGLLLLRGLFVTGILLFAFKERRWRVDYGLDPARSLLAVPFRAKDVPAQRAEFGHPDIAIILTCLSYYYAGLDEEQLRQTFAILFEQHDPSLDYDLWVQVCSAVPESLRTLTGVNTESVEQWNTLLYPLFSRNRETINFYLSRIVFPKEAKEFPSKLSSSGWDLAEKKVRPVTGFSGTNDGQYLFPLHIAQCDADHQRGTNAKVLSCILQPENDHYLCMAHDDNRRRTTREFLQILVAQKPVIRVLLDVGAQMLDLQNHELAQAWLDIAQDASAAIYFNEFDELAVCTRDGTSQLLLSSPYAEQLDRCVIYMDDAHTRGTDIKFPSGFRAAVTLGPKVTKDRLVQGCMRMRKLGDDHTLMFFAPLEVDRRIRTVSGKDGDPRAAINTVDILHWAIRETWENTQRWAPHWVQQGMDHTARYSSWSNFCDDQLTSKGLLDTWLQPEAKKLEDLYKPRSTSNVAFFSSPEIRQRCTDLGVLSLWSVGLDEEQERELVYEVKREREVEPCPPGVSPAKHSVHPDVDHFVKTGIIPARAICTEPRQQAFTPAFNTLCATSAVVEEAFIWSQSMLTTLDFDKTIEGSGKMDDYLRSVQWIVSAKRGDGDVLVIFSPYEVNQLLPDIKSSNKVHLHLYTPRNTKSMKPRDGFALYTIPSVSSLWTPPLSLMDQLNIFAGQLYLNNHESYIRLCRFLCVYSTDLQDVDGIIVEPDGFILPQNRNRIETARTEIAHTFASSPLLSLKALMNLRCKGIDYASTHMGKLLHGRLLSDRDFEG